VFALYSYDRLFVHARFGRRLCGQWSSGPCPNLAANPLRMTFCHADVCVRSWTTFLCPFASLVTEGRHRSFGWFVVSTLVRLLSPALQVRPSVVSEGFRHLVRKAIVDSILTPKKSLFAHGLVLAAFVVNKLEAIHQETEQLSRQRRRTIKLFLDLA